uniref:Uncharacterized protein n=1 Tax=Anguilla anguilla TaxID=7936 RepID=A0A0E9T3Z0_ANGAN
MVMQCPNSLEPQFYNEC